MNIKKYWLRIRGYLHLSKRFDSKDEKRKNSHFFIKNYVSNLDNVSKHRFSPFLHYKIKENRFRRVIEEYSSKKTSHRIYVQKPRPIFYCNHLDAQILAYYGDKINKLLENEYKKNANLNDSVIGYRAIPHNEYINKSTINFAGEAFDFIKTNPELNLVVACLDISSFFDNLNHKELKRAWYKIQNRRTLNDDEYNVFKAVTQSHFIDIEELLPLLPNFDQKSRSFLYKSKKNQLITSLSELRLRLSKYPWLIKRYDKNNTKKGIPQGTPISAVFSNLYFLEADKKIAKLLSDHRGIYRRYSDDILIVCPEYYFEDIYKSLKEVIADLKLEISEAKNQLGYLTKKSINEDWNLSFFQNGILLNKPISYLGFSFDSKKIIIKNSSISKYYRSAKRLIRRSAHFAKQRQDFNKINKKTKDEWIYKRRIFQTKSYLGAKRRKVGGKVYWGNFISYVKNAAKIMNDKRILNQVKNHWKIINDTIKMYEKKYDLKEQKPSSIKDLKQ